MATKFKNPVSKRAFLCMLLTYSLLAGCASQVNMLKPVTADTSLAENEGLVVLRIVNAGGASLPFNQFTINPDNVNADSTIKPERLLALEPFHGNSTVFSSAVNVGNYSVGSIRLFHTVGEGWYSNFVPAEVALGTFSVQPGQVTDLGTLVYYPKFEDGKYIETLIRVPGEEPGAVLEKFFPFYDFDKSSVIGWKEDGFEEARQDSFVSAAQNPVAYGERFLAPDGTLYFLGRLGVLIRRSFNGEWSLDAVDTNLQLNSMAMNNDGEALLGGAEGSLFYKQAAGEWIDISLPNVDMIHDVAFLENGGAQVVVSSESNVTILRSNALTPSDEWQILNRYDSIDWRNQFVVEEKKSATQKRVSKRRTIDVQLKVLEGKHYVSIVTASLSNTLYFASSRTRTYRYDPNSWAIEAEEKLPKISDVIDAGAAEIGIVTPGFWSWSGKTKYYRFDEAENVWDEINTNLYVCGDKSVTKNTACENETLAKKRSFTFVSVPWFKNSEEAIAISSFNTSSVWSGTRSQETKLLHTTDGGQSWTTTDHELPEKYCYSIVTEISDRLLISCNGASGDFYESFDNGKSWEHVRQHQNF